LLGGLPAGEATRRLYLIDRHFDTFSCVSRAVENTLFATFSLAICVRTVCNLVRVRRNTIVSASNAAATSTGEGTYDETSDSASEKRDAPPHA